MIRLGRFSSTLLFSAMFAFGVSAATNSTPNFKEVYDAVRAHMPGSDDAELNRAAVNGFLKELGPKASLADGPEDHPATVAGSLVSKTHVFDDELAYIRMARVADGLAAEL